MSRLLFFRPSILPSSPHSDPAFDLEQPPSSPSSSTTPPQILEQMPNLSHLDVLTSMTHVVSHAAQTRSIVQTPGPRPDHQSIEMARSKLAEIESNLSKSLEELVLFPRPVDVDRLEWRAHSSDKEQQIRQQAEKERAIYSSILQLDEKHEAYEKLLKESEEKLVKIYEKAGKMAEISEEIEEVNVEVVGILEEELGKGLEKSGFVWKKAQVFARSLWKD